MFLFKIMFVRTHFWRFSVGVFWLCYVQESLIVAASKNQTAINTHKISRYAYCHISSNQNTDIKANWIAYFVFACQRCRPPRWLQLVLQCHLIVTFYKIAIIHIHRITLMSPVLKEKRATSTAHFEEWQTLFLVRLRQHRSFLSNPYAPLYIDNFNLLRTMHAFRSHFIRFFYQMLYFPGNKWPCIDFKCNSSVILCCILSVDCVICLYEDRIV